MSISLALALHAAALQNAEKTAFPAAFRGVWDVSIEECHKEFSSDRIVIDDSSQLPPNSAGFSLQIFDISIVDDFEITAIVGQDDEDISWRQKNRFVLSDDRMQLFIETLPIKGHEFHKNSWFQVRCPDNAPDKAGKE